jgi:Flp pilus assembly protein TadD
MIVRNEEANLPACLASAADLVDELVIVDTGSTDRTKEVAARFGARVFDFPWCDDFAAARNETLRHATGDWIFWLDADDRIDQDNRRKLKALFGQLIDETVGYNMWTALVSGTAIPKRVDHVRLFRHHRGIRWRYRVHEQLRWSIFEQGGSVRDTDLTIEHTGYQDAALTRRKSDRNLRLLTMELADQPNNPDVLLLLGKEYTTRNQPAEAVPILERCLALAPGTGPTYVMLCCLLGQAYRHLGNLEQAVAVYSKAREQHPDNPDLLSEEGFLRCLRGDLAGGEACLARLVHGKAAAHADLPLLCIARTNLGVLYQRQGRLAEAEAEYRAALALDPRSGDAGANLTALLRQSGRMP